jgi:putative membrane protein
MPYILSLETLMLLAAQIFAVIVALLHLYFLVLEMFLWDKPKGLKVFGHSLQKAQDSKVLAMNQGLYNGFLSAGIILGLFYATGSELLNFSLVCVVIAGVFGGATVTKRIFFIQSVPAIISLVLFQFS